MKTIQLICIVFVVLLSSFPATIKSKKLADTCFESLAYCMNLIPRDKKYWEKDCCNIRAKRDQAATKQCSCIIANNPQKYLDLIKLFKACGLGNVANYHNQPCKWYEPNIVNKPNRQGSSNQIGDIYLYAIIGYFLIYFIILIKLLFNKERELVFYMSVNHLSPFLFCSHELQIYNSMFFCF